MEGHDGRGLMKVMHMDVEKGISKEWHAGTHGNDGEVGRDERAALSVEAERDRLAAAARAHRLDSFRCRAVAEDCARHTNTHENDKKWP